MIIEKATEQDIEPLFNLYKEIARNPRGIARRESEITESYLASLYHSIKKDGLMMVGKEENNNNLIAEIHAGKYGMDIFNHILTGLTVVVHPEYQGKGLGKQLFSAFLNEIAQNHPEIGRVELESRASNTKSIGLYKDMGFELEGLMKNKSRNEDGTFENSILMAWTNPDFKFE